MDSASITRKGQRVSRQIPSPNEADYLREQNRALRDELERERTARRVAEEQLVAQQITTRRLRNAVAALADTNGATADELEAFLRRQ